MWQALRNGQSPCYTPYLFYPDGMSMVYKNFAWLHIPPWMALRPLTEGVAAYNNLTFLVHLALCGFAALLLAYELTSERRAAFLAGLIYQCWPHRLSQSSHPNLISTWGDSHFPAVPGAYCAPGTLARRPVDRVGPGMGYLVRGLTISMRGVL